MALKTIRGAALDAYLVDRGDTLRAALRQLNATSELFLLVVDRDRRLLGTMTDGDVRRAILAGHGLDDAVSKAMRPDPTTVTPDRLADAPSLLARVRSPVPFLPIVDHDRMIHGLLTPLIRGGAPASALVMAGGRGKRLGARTQTTPKPLVEVAGRPMIARVVEMIENAGIQRVFVSVHYLSEQIANWCAAHEGPATLELLVEQHPLGTAGAIGLLPEDSADPTIVVNADVVTDADLSSMLAFHTHLATDTTIAVARHVVEVPFGVVRADGDGRLVGIDEKPRFEHFVAAGIYVVGAQARRCIERGEHLDMPDLLERAKARGIGIGVFPIHERWRDLGRPGDIDAENARLAAPGGTRP